MPGTGKITVNKREIDDFFGMETLKMIVRSGCTMRSRMAFSSYCGLALSTGVT